MRKITYTVFFVGILLILANLTLTNSLASDGSKLGTLSQEREIQRERVDQLRQEIMETQSLARIESRALQSGFSKRVVLQ